MKKKNKEPEITVEDLLEELETISNDIIGCKIAKEHPELEWKCSQCPEEFGQCIAYNANAIAVCCLHIKNLYQSLDMKRIKKAIENLENLTEPNEKPPENSLYS